MDSSRDPEQPEFPFEQNMPEAERIKLHQDTLRSLQEAFSVTGDGDDTDTSTELHQNAVEAVPDRSESSQ